MKTFINIIAIAILSCIGLNTKAQETYDIIVLMNEKYIECKVDKVDENYVYYQSDSKTEKVTLSEVRTILYADGKEQKIYIASQEQAYVPRTINTSHKKPSQQISTTRSNDVIANTPAQNKDVLIPEMILKEPYNPSLCAISSLFMPGSGMMMADENNKGWMYFGLSMGFLTMTSTFIGVMPFCSGNDEALGALAAMSVISATGYLTVNICSVVDAVKTAKRKNRKYRDVWEKTK